ncbi:MAG: type II toxin-antitoxin system HigB family toxin [Gammaproteobacteria bacterium]
MTVVGRSVLDAFSRKHADTRQWIEHWLAEVEAALWASPREIKEKYSSASFLAGNRVIFNVRGNDYRLEVIVAYGTSVVSVIWAGTHAEYDQRNRKG